MKAIHYLGSAVLALSVGVAGLAVADTDAAKIPAASATGAAHSHHDAAMQMAHADHAEIVIEGAFVRQSMGTVGASAAYMTIMNHGQHADRLVAISTPVAGMAEVHRTSVSSTGMVSMRPAGPVDIPAGGMVALKPGGLHIMLMKLKQALNPGMDIEMTLTFEHAGEMTVTVPVKPVSHGMGGEASMDHNNMKHGSMGAASAGQ